MTTKSNSIYIERADSPFFQKYGISIRYREMDKSWPLHIHDYYELEYFAAGNGTHWINGNPERICPGYTTIVTPNDIHKIDLDEGEPFNICKFRLNRSTLPRSVSMLLDLCSSFKSVHCTGELMSCIDFLTKNIYEQYDALSQNEDDVSKLELTVMFSKLSSVIGLIIQNNEAGEKLSLDDKKIYESMHRAMLYIDAHYKEKLSLGDVADIAGYSKSHFCRIFTKFTGCNFIDYVKDKRLQYASLLLRTTDMNISDIAFTSGYGSISQFIRDYKSAFGALPSGRRGRETQ